jgi:DNA-binding transcriptional MerR regulator
MNQYLTIRKFSELTHTTIDTLKHYDDIGLLKPARIGPNRYRYYLPEQSLELTRILFGKTLLFR